MNILGWILMGLIAGTIAKSLMKKDGGGWVSALVTGVVGAIVGGWIGAMVFNNGDINFFSLWSWLLAIGGSALVIWAYGLITKKS